MLHPIVAVIWSTYSIDWTLGYKPLGDNPKSLIPLATWRFSRDETNYEEILIAVRDILSCSKALSCEWFLSQDKLNTLRYTLQPKNLYSLREFIPEIENDEASAMAIKELQVSLAELYNDAEKIASNLEIKLGIPPQI
ncbi:hypothetical protein EHF33_05765 [Deinococcus psychrotolerans]|uniref:Uncharacterized protein n=1 Tax=Deinococcus psychrotolerans TaxID=2489213 RepID=A0A3G8YAA4_9DEIO|nr:hypothetical protein [Deinococcus psychrotolerans]AZI42318.1 hypothetical protein EHF33_05765 [Deinococcus psychrotolerans]